MFSQKQFQETRRAPAKGWRTPGLTKYFEQHTHTHTPTVFYVLYYFYFLCYKIRTKTIMIVILAAIVI